MKTFTLISPLDSAIKRNWIVPIRPRPVAPTTAGLAGITDSPLFTKLSSIARDPVYLAVGGLTAWMLLNLARGKRSGIHKLAIPLPVVLVLAVALRYKGDAFTIR